MKFNLLCTIVVPNITNQLVFHAFPSMFHAQLLFSNSVSNTLLYRLHVRITFQYYTLFTI